ncbi:MAG TPA: translocation/assembly module TamB domain-containing protein [Candidatus Binataceae bacterium]|nr:translocation/assembly module TamB domain-containing protein [Candidatus Binataceae bacterium]
MRAALRSLLRVLAGLLAIFVVILAALMIYIRTASFNQLLKREVNSVLSGRFHGQITIGGIQASRIGRVDLYNFVITYHGRELVGAPVVEIGYSLMPLLWHQIVLTVAVDRPQIRVARNAQGKWDLAEALQPATPSTSGPSAYTVGLTALSLSGGSIDLAPAGLSGPIYQASAANLDAQAELPSSGVRLNVRRFSAHLTLPNLPPADITLVASYDGSSQPATIQLASLNLTTQASALSATATVRDLQSPAVSLHVTIARLAARDLSWIKNYPLRENVTGSINVNGSIGALHVVIDLFAGRANAALAADVSLAHPKQPVYNGKLTVTHLDLARLVLGLKLAGQLDTSVQVKGQGIQLSALNAALNATVKADVRALVINNLRAGNVNIDANAKNGRAYLAAAIINGSSTITADAAAVNFLTPSVQTQVAVRHLDLQTFTGSRSQKSDLNGKLKLAAPRIDPAKLDLPYIGAHVLLTLSRSSLQNVTISDGIVDARLHNGVVSLAQAKLTAAAATLTAHGDIGLTRRTETRLGYSMRAQRLAPLLQLAQFKGDGSLNLNGTAQGVIFGANSPNLHAQGSATADNLNLNGMTAANVSISYDLSRIGQSGLPLGRAQIGAANLSFGTTRIRVLDAATRITRQKPLALTLSLNLIDAQGNPDIATANLAEQDGNVSGALTRLSVIAPDGPWHLAAPAHFLAGAHSISVESFDVRNGSRELAFNGTMRIAGPQNVTVTARNLDLALIRPLLQPKHHPAGTLDAHISITGTASAPLIRASLTGQGLAMDSQRIGDLKLLTSYNPGTADVDLALYQDSTHQMTLTGTMPLTVNWARGFHAHLGNNVALKLYSAGLRLAGLAALAPPRTIKDVTGQLMFDLAISGSPLHPSASGTAAMQNLGGQIIPLGVKIKDSHAQMRMTPELFTLDDFVINAGEGSITGSGTVALTNYTPGAANLTVAIQKFPAIHTERYQATLGGELHLRGSLEFPDITGRVGVLNATVRPDLAFLTTTKYRPDETIVVIRPGQSSSLSAPAAGTGQIAGAPAATSNFFGNLAINVAIIVHRDSWIRHPDATVELAGHIEAIKERLGPLTLIGEINTVRGWISFNGHTFTLVSGQILFTGGREINPSLNIDAQYTVSQYTVDVLVTGFASKPKLKLQSTPPLPQSDILSLLIFGTTSGSLGQNQSASLQQEAAQMAAGAAASTIGQALSNSLGLENLGLSFNGAAGNGGVGFGRYISRNTYVSASQSITGRMISIQYYILRWLSITTSANADGSSNVSVNLIKQY